MTINSNHKSSLKIHDHKLNTISSALKILITTSKSYHFDVTLTAFKIDLSLALHIIQHDMQIDEEIKIIMNTKNVIQGIK